MTSDTPSLPTSRRRRLSPGWAALVAAVLLLGFAGNAAAAGNPTANIAVGPLPATCGTTPRSATCQQAMVTALDRARAGLGLGPYLLPSNFYSLNGSEQLLILCNLDRLAYGLPPVTGLSPVLNAVAATGVTADADPDPSALLSSMPSFGWSSNWAGGYGNALEAYYAWMYSDGWAGRQTSNLDCTSPTSSGCWGHRQDVLAFSQPGLLSMGASVSRDPQGQIGYAITLVWTPQTNWTSYSYSWASAQAAGAGSVGTWIAGSRR
jgi:hypothetical protein